MRNLLLLIVIGLGLSACCKIRNSCTYQCTYVDSLGIADPNNIVTCDPCGPSDAEELHDEGYECYRIGQW